MKTILKLLFVLIPFSLSAQTSVYHPFPDSNAYWNMKTWGCCYADCGFMNPMITDAYFSYYILGDTIINATTYHKLYKTSGHAHEHCALAGGTDHWWTFPGEYFGAYRQDTAQRKVYLYTSLECILYDFSVNVGDTLNGCGWSNGAIVSSIDSILIGNTYRKQFHFYSSQFSIIEGIGSTGGLAEPLIIFEYGGDLLCFSQDGQTLYPDTDSTCIMMSGINKTNDEALFSLAPNPFHASTELKLSLSDPDGDLIIFNTLGERVHQQKISAQVTTINRNALPDGIYFFRVLNDKEVVLTGKLIVQ